MDYSDVFMALKLTGIGLSIVFAVLILFMISIKILNTVFPDKSEKK